MPFFTFPPKQPFNPWSRDFMSMWASNLTRSRIWTVGKGSLCSCNMILLYHTVYFTLWCCVLLLQKRAMRLYIAYFLLFCRQQGQILQGRIVFCLLWLTNYRITSFFLLTTVKKSYRVFTVCQVKALLYAANILKNNNSWLKCAHKYTNKKNVKTKTKKKKKKKKREMLMYSHSHAPLNINMRHQRETTTIGEPSLT